MRKSTTKLFSLLLALCMVVGLAGTAMADEKLEGTLVVGSGNFNQKFSPFFGETVYDNYINDFMVHMKLMYMDRNGEVIMNGIEGETKAYGDQEYTYTGPADFTVERDEKADTTTYTVKLKEGILFSDGVEMTADDIIFNYYVYNDPGYTGPTTLRSFNIVGLDSYLAQVPQELYDKFAAEFDKALEAKDEALNPYIEAAWKEDLMDLVNYVVKTYGSSITQLGFTEEQMAEDEGLQIAMGMFGWGFGEPVDKPAEGAEAVPGKFAAGEKVWDLAAGERPTLDEFYEVVFAAYEGDAEAYWTAEQIPNDGYDVFGAAKVAYVQDKAADDPATKEGVPNIAGINKLDKYTVSVTTNGYSAPAIYSICGITIAPMHFYGDPEQFDYENNKFGHPFGDVSIVEAKTTTPLVGAGPYKYINYENKAVFLEANENYYKGAPKIKYIQYKETQDAEMAPGVQTGTIDIANISGSVKNFDQIKGYNANKELSGETVFTSLVDNRGYGYIGQMASRVKVGTDNFSDESKNLRKGLATVLAVYRDVAFNSYYGEAADVINYPISNVIWAAPKRSDEGYKVAFSVDVEGNDIYTSDMSTEDKYAAAIEAAKGFLTAAGYTLDETSGKFTTAPEGAALQYEVWIGGGGTGDHPTFAVLTDAKNALETIGIELIINDLSNTQELWDGLKAGTVDMWCAAWQNNNPDPDMYQIYHSDNVPGKPGATGSNHYRMESEELDQLIMDARLNPDQEYRKPLYKQALDILVDAAVEIPAYQRQNAIIFSSERINVDTITPQITTWWDWENEVHLMELK